jgi:hypothetical protein
MQCHAKAKHRGQRCRQAVVPGMDVCHYHGGKTSRGPASPQFRTGRYSKFLPSRLVARYHESLNDPELTSLRSELALTDARLVDLLGRVHSGESGALWLKLQRAYRDFRRDQHAGNVVKMREAFAAMETHLEAAVVDTEAWAEIHEPIETRRKLAATESQRLITLRQMITAEQAMLLIGTITDIVTRHITDKQVLTNITIELQRLMEVGEARYGLEPGDDGGPSAEASRWAGA